MIVQRPSFNPELKGKIMYVELKLERNREVYTFIAKVEDVLYDVISMRVLSGNAPADFVTRPNYSSDWLFRLSVKDLTKVKIHTLEELQRGEPIPWEVNQ